MKVFYCLSLALLVAGCAPTVLNIDRVGQSTGQPLRSSVGEIFFSREVMTGQDNGMGRVFNGKDYKIEIVVRSATAEKLVLDYSEFMKPVAGQYGGYMKDGEWLKKPAFDKSLEFDLKESKNVFYKEYEFSIDSVGGGRLVYTRTK